MKKSTICILAFVFAIFSFQEAEAQVHLGIYHGGVLSQIGVGTDVDKKIFGEVRFLAGDVVNYVLGVEALGHYNVKQTEWYNLHIGLMVGYTDVDEGRIGLPLGMDFKPISNHRQFSVLLEGTPLVANSDFTLRANIGLRYTFRKE
ncbi:hypothetical protein [Aquiflexum sp.]|uniref:hypothetical protein n=1 Tax=Aquiflexum sp. TaxID=1872584 RepID=UPI003593A1E8